MTTIVKETLPLGDVLTITSGFAFKSQYFNETQDGLPLIRCRDVNTGLADVYYSGEYDKNYVVKRGELLVSMDGDFRVVRWQHDNALLNQRVCRLEPHTDRLDPDYLFYFLPKELDRIHAKTSFATVKHLSAKTIREIEIPLPPLLEQKRIADILDKADAIRRQRQDTLETGKELIPALFHDMFDNPVANPRGWPERSLGELLERIDSGWSPKCEDRPADEGEWGILKLGAVTYCEYAASENKALPPSASARPELEIKAGDVLFTRKNTYDLVAACALVRATRPRLMLCDLIFRLCIREDIPLLPEYLWQVLLHPILRSRIQRLAGGSSGSMPNISKQRLATVTIPLPPLELQEKFGKAVHKFMDMQDGIATRAREETDDLFNSLVQRAFRGEL